jgi:hypothetical protein
MLSDSAMSSAVSTRNGQFVTIKEIANHHGKLCIHTATFGADILRQARRILDVVIMSGGAEWRFWLSWLMLLIRWHREKVINGSAGLCHVSARDRMRQFNSHNRT